jgi:hypothetical protein
LSPQNPCDRGLDRQHGARGIGSIRAIGERENVGDVFDVLPADLGVSRVLAQVIVAIGKKNSTCEMLTTGVRIPRIFFDCAVEGPPYPIVEKYPAASAS